MKLHWQATGGPLEKPVDVVTDSDFKVLSLSGELLHVTVGAELRANSIQSALGRKHIAVKFLRFEQTE